MLRRWTCITGRHIVGGLLFPLRYAFKEFNVCNVLLGCVGLFLWSALLIFFSKANRLHACLANIFPLL